MPQTQAGPVWGPAPPCQAPSSLLRCLAGSTFRPVGAQTPCLCLLVASRLGGRRPGAAPRRAALWACGPASSRWLDSSLSWAQGSSRPCVWAVPSAEPVLRKEAAVETLQGLAGRQEQRGPRVSGTQASGKLL